LLGIGSGAVFASIIALQFSAGRSVSEWAGAWVCVMGGPISGLDHGWLLLHSPCGVGCLVGLVFMPAHPIRPHQTTGLLTLLGLACWFFLGFMEVLVHYVV
jgi:hypothetical protein